MSFELRSLIAQTLLAEEGHYHGKLDGIWGPLSISAADAWNAAEAVKAIPISAPTPYELARRHLGTAEIPGSKHNSKIVTWLRMLASWIADDETAWCSAFVNAMAQEAGYERSGKLNARSWLSVGTPLQASEVRRGDVVIFWRVAKDSWEGHVGFVESYVPGSSSVLVLGGNQSNRVSIATYQASQVLGFRRLRSLDALQGRSSSIV